MPTGYPMPVRLHAARTLAASLSAFLPVAADAHAPDSPPDAPVMTQHLLSFLDRNADCVIDPYEGADAIMLLTREADLDANGSTTTAEIETYINRARALDIRERTAFFNELDADNDGRIQLDDLPDDLVDEDGWIFELADADRDGAVVLSELLAVRLDNPQTMYEHEYRVFFEELDADGDGSFAFTEIPAPDRAAFLADFGGLDANADGRLTWHEFSSRIREEFRGATFEVVGTNAIMTGVIGPTTPGRVLELRLTHPQVDTIVLLDVPGSLDDESNLRAARCVRRFGYDTHVPADGEIASGGTDFFLAGVERTAETGARLGVHTWGVPGDSGDMLPRSHPAHRPYLAYYEDMGIPADFYWFTLRAAPPEDAHWMTQQEIKRFRMTTAAATDTDANAQD